jgi:hydroxypyruvate isomerase
MNIGVCLEAVLTNLSFEERMARVAALGIKYAEFWMVDDKGSPEELAKMQKKYGITLTNSVIGSPDGSLGGGLTNPKNRPQWLERAKMTLDFNKRAGIGATIVCSGNVAPGLSDKEMYQSVLDGVKATADLAEKYDVTLILEPLNTRYDHVGYWMNHSDIGADICRKINSPRVKLLFDCYHMQIMDGDLVNYIRKNIDVIGHFHSAGVPGRHELFGSEIHYPRLIQEIEKLNYKGVFGLEYFPEMSDHEESLKKTFVYLQGKTNR